MRVEASRWWRRAVDDLETARVTLEARRWAPTVFFAQQAAEKALKAVWLERTGEAPPRTHDLVRLAEMTGCDARPEQLDELSRAYLVSRYPDVGTGPGDEVSESDARRLMGVAEQVLAWARRSLRTTS